MKNVVIAVVILVACLGLLLFLLLQILPTLMSLVTPGPIAGIVSLLLFGLAFYGIYRLIVWVIKEKV